MSSYLRPRRPPPAAIARLLQQQKKSAAHQHASETAPLPLGSPPRKLPPGTAGIAPPPPQPPQQRINLLQRNADLPRSQPLTSPAAASPSPATPAPVAPKPQPQTVQPPLRSVRPQQPQQQIAPPSFSLEDMVRRHYPRAGGTQGPAASGSPIPQTTTLFQRSDPATPQAALVKRHGTAAGEPPMPMPSGSGLPGNATAFQRWDSATVPGSSPEAFMVKRHGTAAGEPPMPMPSGGGLPGNATAFQRWDSATVPGSSPEAFMVKRHGTAAGEPQVPGFPGSNPADNASLFHRADSATLQSLPARSVELNQAATAQPPSPGTGAAAPMPVPAAATPQGSTPEVSQAAGTNAGAADGGNSRATKVKAGAEAVPQGSTTSQAMPQEKVSAGKAPDAVPEKMPHDPSLPRAAQIAALRLYNAKQHGAVIYGGRTVPHPDGKGLLHETGFASSSFRELGNNPNIPYRDDHGRQHAIAAKDIRRVKDEESGKMYYHFMADGKPVKIEEGSTPLFDVDAQGVRSVVGADGTRQGLDYDPNAAAAAGVPLHEKAAQEAREKMMAQGAELSRALQEKTALAAQAKDHLAATEKKVAELEKIHESKAGKGPEAQKAWDDLSNARQERIAAVLAHVKAESEAEPLKQQHDEHYRAMADNNRARVAKIERLRGAAAESPADEAWQKEARTVQGDPRVSDLNLIAEVEKTDPARAEAMRQALVPQHAQRLFDAAEKSFGRANGPSGAAAGKSMSLREMMMQAPPMATGKRQQVPMPQEIAARDTEQNALGIDDPDKVRVTRGANGSYDLSRPGAEGGGTAAPFARMDAGSKRITLVAGPDGKLSQEALDMAAKAPAGGAPIFHPGGEKPLSAGEMKDLVSRGVKAAGSTADRRKADAALTKEGLSPEGIGKLVQQGRISVQDGKFLNDKFNSGVKSYAERQANEASAKLNAGLQKMQQDAKGTKDKPVFRSWMDKDDPHINAQV
jgi:hypothetical protein